MQSDFKGGDSPEQGSCKVEALQAKGGWGQGRGLLENRESCLTCQAESLCCGDNVYCCRPILGPFSPEPEAAGEESTPTCQPGESRPQGERGGLSSLGSDSCQCPVSWENSQGTRLTLLLVLWGLTSWTEGTQRTLLGTISARSPVPP